MIHYNKEVVLMYKYSSNVTFLYFNDLNYGSKFIEEVLDLSIVMDQGWAKIYQINETSFLGIVKLNKETEYKGNTLVSFNTREINKEHERLSKLGVPSLTEIKHFDKIPLNSFFFKDNEGHDFEIQQFIKSKDIKMFG
jgi:hypothetical protein